MSSRCRYAVGIIGNCTRQAMKSRGGKTQRSMPWILQESFGRKRMPRRTHRRSDVAVPALAELQTKLDGVRREVRNLTVMGMDPRQSAQQAALIKELERSARAEMRLRTIA